MARSGSKGKGFDAMLADLEIHGAGSGAKGAKSPATADANASNFSALLADLDALEDGKGSVGWQIIHDRRKQDAALRQRADEAQRALEEKAFRRDEAAQRAREAAEQLKEDEASKAADDRARRLRERRALDLQDAAIRADALAARATCGGLAVRHLFGRQGDAGIPAEYIQALIRTLAADKTIAPIPADFASHDGFTLYDRTVAKPLQDVISDCLYARHVERPANPNRLPAPIDIFFKVVEANALVHKENRSRDAYCRIEFGQIPNPDTPPKTGIEIFMTETCPQTTSPVWNQHVDVSSRDLSDVLIVSVWDRRKDDYLGRVVLSVKDVVMACGASGNDGFVSRWAKLEPRGGKTKDKYVGGEIQLEMSIDMERPPEIEDLKESDPIAYLECLLLSTDFDFKTLYTTLLRSCLILDINTNIPPATQPPPIDPNSPHVIIDLLSEESTALLKVWEQEWMIRPAFKVLAYLDLVFQKYKVYEVPVWALLNAYEELYGNMKRSNSWLNMYEKPILIDTLEEMHSHYKTQVSNYKEYYPKNKPDEALESTILLLRMIFKSPVFREVHTELPKSFRVEIKDIMVKASNNRFKKLLALSSPLDEMDVEEVVSGVTRLSDLLVDDIVSDYKYFKKPFEIELDIVKLNADVFFHRFVGVLSSKFDTLLANEHTVEVAITNMFALLKALRVFESKYVRIYPGIKKSPAYDHFTIENWIAPFIFKWLDHMASLTVEWVASAVKEDNFEVLVSEGGGDQGSSLTHSSSIMDLFQAFYKELDFIMDLKWSNEVQNAAFIQKFGKTVCLALTNYCEVVGIDEVTVEDDAVKTGQFTNFVNGLRMKKGGKGPADITLESCVKLCNLEFALTKIDEMHKLMNVTALAGTQKDHRASLATGATGNPTAAITTKASFALHDENKIKGAFRIELMYAENVKPVTKSGLANPYMVIRLPDGTIMPAVEDEAAASNGDAKKPKSTTLTGSACELARTRPVNETINPVWDESFSTLLPPVSHLDVYIYSRNLLQDELCGKSVIDLSGRLSRLRQKLADHHTHDVYIAFEPQGRGLVRMTLEGEQEDVDYWFRNSRERLKRTQNDLLRALTAKISPYLKEVILKCVKEHEAVAMNRGFFNSTVQYSNQTSGGVPIDQLVSPTEADIALSPLTEYLNKNLETLCRSLSMPMVHQVIKLLWDEVLVDIEYVLIPPLYGQLETTRRFLNKRQVSLCGWALSILRAFLHADGEELGLAFRVLDNRKYLDLNNLMTAYFNELPRIKREYELSFVNGREKEMLLRLVRVRIERQEEFTPAEREDGRKWVDVQLAKRRDR
ncbi:hypothetical protein HDU98_000827 [Podochytrium sp. JEL0797]|nr:hypothetical protein HDU98_000827 [Podochytrium sp. JEL0797]